MSPWMAFLSSLHLVPSQLPDEAQLPPTYSPTLIARSRASYNLHARRIGDFVGKKFLNPSRESDVVEREATEVRVMLVDDHQLFREGLVALLGMDKTINIVGQAATSRQASALADEAKPDVVILDLTLPDGDGIATTRELLRSRPRTRILILTMHTTPFFVRKALAAGAAGYALKSQPAEEILEAVRAVARGETYVSPQIAPPTDEAVARRSQDNSLSPLDELSPREREVFDLVMRGLSNQAIGENLCISIKTVETHRSHINKKLDVHSTGQLIRLAALQGLVSQ